MPAVHGRDGEDIEPPAKRPSLTNVLTVETDNGNPISPHEDEAPSTPVDPALACFGDPRPTGPPGDSTLVNALREAGLTTFCEALALTGLRDEITRFGSAGVTILAPTNEAFTRLPGHVLGDARLMRQLLLGHVCAGTSSLATLKEKECAVAVAGQTHAVSEANGQLTVGTAHFGRTDFACEGGMIHELSSTLLVLWLVRDSHSEQVWKKSLQPSPVVSALGGALTMGACMRGARARAVCPRMPCARACRASAHAVRVRMSRACEGQTHARALHLLTPARAWRLLASGAC